MTDGQRLSIEQLKEVVLRDSHAIDIEDLKEPESDNDGLVVEVSIHCGQLQKAAGGLPLRERERFTILVPPAFPFQKPEIWVQHTRFAGSPHVQWSRHLCLYQAPQTEWNPEDGIFGFIDRLDLWLKRGALNQLDADGEPLHPPVAYPDGLAKEAVIIRADAPEVGQTPWLGYAHLKRVSGRIELLSWSPGAEKRDGYEIAPVILLSDWLPWEFPGKLSELLRQLGDRQGDIRAIVRTLKMAALLNDEGNALYVVVGSPMRGTRGGQLKQHLAVWFIEPVYARELCTSFLLEFTKNDVVREIAQEALERVIDWALTASVHWCRVFEARSEITVRRDLASPTSVFRDKRIVVLGCGALGSHVALFLAQAGARLLVLRDNGIVKPGILVRQLFDDDDIGRPKATALATRLKRLRPEIEVIPKTGDVSTAMVKEEDWTDGCDFVIDCTASLAVQMRLEQLRRTADIPVISMMISGDADRGIVGVSHREHTGGPLDVYLRTKVKLCKNLAFAPFTSAFFPEKDRTALFQPEPGCSDPTFIGSGADVASLSGAMLNLASMEIGKPTGSAAAFLVVEPSRLTSESADVGRVAFSWQPDTICLDSHKGYEVRLSAGAWLDMQASVEKSRRLKGDQAETGGLLYGKRDDILKILWVTEAGGPPPDSKSSPEMFLCGIEGAEKAFAERVQRYGGTVKCLGTWHTHPVSRPLPSLTDVRGVAQILTESSLSPTKTLLLIVGYTTGSHQLGAFVFERNDFLKPHYEAVLFPKPTALKNRSCQPPRVGLALSGGGSRAIAFHLGCLRALHDRGVLDQLYVVSAVSGGSVLAALYMYSCGSFAEFDEKAVRLLKEGLVRKVARSLFLSGLTPGVLGTMFLAGTAATLGRVCGRQPAFLRWKSRTHALQSALAEVIGNQRLSAPTRGNIPVLFNACDLRSGNAFRYQSGRIGSSAVGISTDDPPVARAVAASAAYPLLLPAFDDIMEFNKRGTSQSRRVVVTDGGVFDNLGTSCMEPGRDEAFSEHIFRPDFIISCNAGQGPLRNTHIPYGLYTRMGRSVEVIFKKNQDAAMKRLHHFASSGQLKGFILPYLGQSDASVPQCPIDLVARESVSDYPTDFSPMTERNIELLTTRGEQLTAALLSFYCPEL
jgi:integrative and conjugative element protein (TIGR02256 family)